MAALTSQTIVLAGIVPSAVAVGSTDTIAANQFGTTGVMLRVINAGASPDVVTITDPTLTTGMGSAATNPTVSVTNGTSKEIFIPTGAINSSTQVATVAHSLTAGVTCEVKRI